MSFYKEYFCHHERFEAKYGKDKSLVLIQNGSFMEIYATETRGPKVAEISNLLNMAYTKKNKKIEKIDESNPFLLGYPIASQEKYLKILIDYGYTVIVIHQFSDIKDPKKISRKITGIYSSGTYINDTTSPDSNNIICLYIEDEIQKNGKILMCIGCSVIDLTTGENIVYETYSTNDDEKYALDETVRFINSFNPKEIIIFRKVLDHENVNKQKHHNIMNKEALILYLELESKNYFYSEKINKIFYKISYQQEFLMKIFEDTGMLSVIEYLDMEKMPFALISYICLLDYAYQHNENIIKNIYKPNIFQNNKHLILGNNAIYQLNILENTMLEYNKNTKFKCLFDVVNNTSTAMGRRFLKSKLVSPIIDFTEIQCIYDTTEEILNKNLYLEIENKLKNIMDLERLQRKLSLNILNPFEFGFLIESYQEVQIIIDIIKKKTNKLKSKLPETKILKELYNFIDDINKTFNLEELKKYSLIDDKIITSFFKKNIYKEIDKLELELSMDVGFMNTICNELSKYVDDSNKQGLYKKAKKNVIIIDDLDEEIGLKNSTQQLELTNNELKDDKNKIYLKNNVRDGYYLCLTKLRADSLRKNLQKVDKIKITDNYSLDVNSIIYKELEKTKKGKINSVKIFFKDLSKKSDDIVMIKNNFVTILIETFQHKMSDYYNKYKKVFKKIVEFISYVDFVKSNAKNAKMFNYCKPTIVLKNNKALENGFISCNGLRHPIIERIKTEYEYVPHDIKLGRDDLWKEGDEEMDGMLLYGINSCGKCVSPITEIMMHSGLVKQAKNIKIGDKLMGDDSKPRTVLSTTKGKGQMYRIIPTKGEPFEVNGPHILCLKSSGYKYIIWNNKENRYKVKWFNKLHKHQAKSFGVKKAFYKSTIGKFQAKTCFETKELAYKAAQKFLNVVETDEGEILEISVDDYLKNNSFWKSNYYLYRTSVEFKKRNIEMDPYIIGHWLGDGDNNKAIITSADKEIVEYLRKELIKYNLSLKQGRRTETTRHDFHYQITNGECIDKINNKWTNNDNSINHLYQTLKKYNLLNNKHIPDNYKYNSRENRLKILAGIIDSDGCNASDYGFDICLKDKKLLEDIIFLSRSLGFACYLTECEKTCTNAPNGPKKGKYYRTYIGGEALKDIPLLLNYKIPKKSDNKSREATMITSFKIEKLKIDDYVGFEVDGNKRFLLGDFTVTHNSTTMKAIGMSVIMAQSGLFVPATSFKFSPFDSLFVRITGFDNLFKGLSSFAVEMTELRAILKQATKKTLVIGDEVARGTEHTSGNAIVAASIITLSRAKCCFIFASHLHDIPKMSKIQELKNIKCFHLSVEYDKVNDILIFDRKLKPGSGELIYGLTVAQYIIHDSDFIKLANEIKNELLYQPNAVLNDKASHYNTNLFIHECKLCGKSIQEEGTLDTHHINFQENFNENGFMEGKTLKKNALSNLITICKSCHMLIHDKKLIELEGYVQTSSGRKLKAKTKENTKLNNKNIIKTK
ncbi:DNA mismatch repair protein MutS [uncultured virus]|nr:DNA mismatch repair protein MutS [uncultured virus]